MTIGFSPPTETGLQPEETDEKFGFFTERICELR